MFYIGSLNRGGAERVVSILASEFAARGYECTLVTTYAPQPMEYPVDSRVKRYFLIKDRSQNFAKRNVAAMWKLRVLCKELNPDVLVTFMQDPILRALAATVGLPIKNIVSVRNDPAIYWTAPLSRIAAALLLHRVDGCVFQTEEAQEKLSKRLTCPSWVIPNPVQECFFAIDRDADSSTIVSCGRLVEQKNQRVLIRAFASVAESHPSWSLLIYGDGPLREDLSELIRSEGLDGRIELMGLTEHMAVPLSRASIFALSSDYEGMPNALMEAMAAGLACVATDCPCGGPRELLGADAGILVPVNDEGAIAEAFSSLMDDSELRGRLSVRARERAAEFDKDTVLFQWIRAIGR